MPVDAFKNNTSAVEEHQPFPQFKPPETKLLFYNLCSFSLTIHHFNQELIQFRDLRTPEGRSIHDEKYSCRFILLYRCLPLSQDLIFFYQAEMHGAFSLDDSSYVNHSGRIVIRQFRHDRQIFDCCMRQHIQKNITEYSGKPIKILILKPAAGRPFKYSHCNSVLPFTECFREAEVCRVKAVFAITDIASV